MFVGWQIATTTGMVLAGAIALPPLIHLAAPAAITALLALALTTRVAIAAAAVSALVTLVTRPPATGLEIFAGLAAGTAAERARS